MNMQIPVVCLFGTALALGAWSDIRSRRVPNTLVLALFAGGLALTFSPLVQVTPMQSLAGVGIGLALWLPLWLVGMLGAGDVKFFAAACAWIGPSLAWRASLASAMLGGVMAVGFLVYQRGLRQGALATALTASQAQMLIRHAAETGGASAAPAQSRTFPYAVPMAIVLWVAAVAPRVFES